MRKTLYILFILISSTQSFWAQDTETDIEEIDYSKNVESIDAIVTSLYNVISGDRGFERDWSLFQHLFKEDAKLIPAGKKPKDTLLHVRYMSPRDYVSTSGTWLEENGFHEREIHRVTNTFGNIAQVFSTYEAYKNKEDDTPFMRGINSIQLLNDGYRWWIINVYWTQETENNPIPQAYLPPKE
ncbi:hypothetical protein [Corallibacter sp.]|uniref:hypothetical protein n=1 Tax=Corallibacter sp. TaxID=2038084 RepID=UPI003AB76201